MRVNSSIPKNTGEKEEGMVLLPPLFGAGVDPKLPLCLSGVRISGLLQHVTRQSLAQRLLAEYFESGVWFSSQTLDGAHVLAGASQFQMGQGTKGFLEAAKDFTSIGNITLRAHTLESPLLTVSRHFNDDFQAKARTDAAGISSAGFLFDLSTVFRSRSPPQSETFYYRNDPFKVDKAQSEKARKSPLRLLSEAWLNANFNLSDPVRSFQSTLCYESPRVILAGEVLLPMKSLWPKFATFVSCDLNNAGDQPLILTVARDMDETSRISLAQSISFDRLQFNLLEDRASKVRNNISWTIQMAKSPHDKAALEAAVAWQLNRVLAIKGSLLPSGDVRGAVMFKRWKEPSITCSFIFTGRSESGVVFGGVGVELESGSQGNYSYNDGGSKLTKKKTPLTKAIPITRQNG